VKDGYRNNNEYTFGYNKSNETTIGFQDGLFNNGEQKIFVKIYIKLVSRK
jgi:hypothetical protein